MEMITPNQNCQRFMAPFYHPDGLVFCTDGLTEAANSQEDYFDEYGVIEVITADAHQPADEILSANVQSWQDFIGELPQMDDLTMIIAGQTN